jgi:hypothetical protein
VIASKPDWTPLAPKRRSNGQRAPPSQPDLLQRMRRFFGHR